MARKFVTPGRSYKDPSRVLKTEVMIRSFKYHNPSANFIGAEGNGGKDSISYQERETQDRYFALPSRIH